MVKEGDTVSEGSLLLTLAPVDAAGDGDTDEVKAQTQEHVDASLAAPATQEAAAVDDGGSAGPSASGSEHPTRPLAVLEGPWRP